MSLLVDAYRKTSMLFGFSSTAQSVHYVRKDNVCVNFQGLEVFSAKFKAASKKELATEG